MGVVYGGRGKLCVDSGERGVKTRVALQQCWLGRTGTVWPYSTAPEWRCCVPPTHPEQLLKRKAYLTTKCLPSTPPTTEIRGFGPGQSILFRGRLDRRGPRSRLSPQKERTRRRARCGSKFTLGHIFPMVPRGFGPALPRPGPPGDGHRSDEARTRPAGRS